jgi:HEAT repeat protein
MLCCRIAIIGLVILLASTCLVAGQSSENQAYSVRLSRYGDLLLEDHIELTKPALIRALKNPNPEVRYLAAMKLSEDKATDAIPEVKEALAAEKIPETRVNIAVGLGLLGDPGGRDELKRLCADETFPPEFRLYAVRYMFDLGVEKDEGCLNAAEAIVQTVDADYDHRITALELLPRFRGLTPEDSKKVFDLVVDRLDDPEPTVRMQASEALVDLGDPAAAVSSLETAMAKEKEEPVRSVFEKDLEKLRGQSEEVGSGGGTRSSTVKGTSTSQIKSRRLAHPYIATEEAAPSLTLLVKDGHDAAKS